MGVSIEHLLKAKNIYDQHGSLTDQADMLNALASYYSENEKLDKAVDSYRDALNRYKQEGDTL